MELILASTSKYRKALVGRLGLPFRSEDPMVDESSWKTEMGGGSPRALAEALALAKAKAVAARFPEAVVIGGDQVVAFEGQILGKPGTDERASRQLESMAGRSHELITSMAVITPDQIRTRTEVATLRFRPLTTEAITRYVAIDHPFDCAGSYKLEAMGISLFDRIDADDHSAIMGIPLIALTSILIEVGFSIP